jgi:hypothetical protein
MIPDLRNGILSSDPILEPGETLEQNVLYSVQLIFFNLLESEKEYYSPDLFIKNFKMFDQEINVRVQQDATEFLSAILATLESKLKGTTLEKLLTEVVMGTTVSEVKSLESQYPYVS